MPLTVKRIEAAKYTPRGKHRLPDGGGLNLVLYPSGTKAWVWRYRRPVTGEENNLVFGHYPEVSLAEAREKLAEAKKMRRQGIDPGEERKRDKAGARDEDSFEAVARAWFEKNRHLWSDKTALRKLRRMENHIFPLIGTIPIDKVDAQEVRRVLLRLETMGKLDTATRVRGIIDDVMKYAIGLGLARRNPVPDTDGAIAAPQGNHRPAITDTKEVGALLRAIDGYNGDHVTRCYMRLAPLVFVRTGELIRMRWSEIDFDERQWNAPAETMKMNRPHIVPLSRQALTILEELRPLTSHAEWVFPGQRSESRPLSVGTGNAALRRLGYCTKTQHCMHGFKTMASTLLNEEGWNRDWIEMQLAHVEENKVRGAYNRAQYLEGRTKMLQAWADHLDNWRDRGKIIPIHAASGE